MNILCQERYDEAIAYATKKGDTSLQSCIDRLKQWEKNSNGKYEIVLYKDFAPYSMGFAERAKDGTNGIVGGLIYHGNPDKSLSIQLTPKEGWQIHT